MEYNTIISYELLPKFENVKSYYKKATVILQDAETIELKSYESKICKITKGKSISFAKNKTLYSNTTLRHLREFLRQNKLENLCVSKKELFALLEKNNYIVTL